MNTKRLICLALALLLALTPLITLAAGEKYVQNKGAAPLGVFAAMGDEKPVRTLAPGERLLWLGEERWNGALWYRVEGGYVPAGPGVEVIETPAAPAEQPAMPVEPSEHAQPTEPADPAAPAVPSDPAEPDQPAESTDPAEPSDPAEPADPAEPQAPEQAEEPAAPAADRPFFPAGSEAGAAAGTEGSEPERQQAPQGNGAEPAKAADDDPGDPGDPNDPGTPAEPADPDPTPSTGDPEPSASSDPYPTPTSSSDPGPTPSASPKPGGSPSPSPSPTPRPGGAGETELIIDTACIYAGMTKSYADGYMPTVSKGKALLVLPLLGDVMGDVVRVTPDISTSGPFLYGNYQFDLKKSTQKARDAAGNETSRQVFLISLSLDLAKNRYNGTYPVSFRVSYTDRNGESADQYFTLQVTITDGKNPSSGGGGGGPTAVKKPVLVLEKSEVSTPVITGGESFVLKLQVKNVGDLEARNVRVSAAADGQGLFRSDSLAPVFLTLLNKEGSAEIEFPFASDKTVFAGRHGLTVAFSYEDKYGNCYGDSVPLQINVTQESSIGFDEMKLPETLTSGDTFTQPVCVYNTGYAPVYNVRCTLRMDGLIAASAFLGTLEPQQSADKAISVFVTTLAGKEKYGESYGELIVSYEDMAGQEHTEYQSLRTTVQAPVVQTDEEKAKQEKEQKEQQTLSQWWVSLLVSIAFILIILSVIVIARFSRMLKMK